MKYLENSPIFMADRVNTPLMMIHNDQDDAVPWYQGIEYYLALRRLGKEVYLLNYNGQPHNLTNRNAARDFAVRMFQFFEYHLERREDALVDGHRREVPRPRQREGHRAKGVGCEGEVGRNEPSHAVHPRSSYRPRGSMKPLRRSIPKMLPWNGKSYSTLTAHSPTP